MIHKFQVSFIKSFFLHTFKNRDLYFKVLNPPIIENLKASFLRTILKHETDEKLINSNLKTYFNLYFNLSFDTIN